MTYVLSALVAVLLVLGQTLWKLGIEKSPSRFDTELIFSKDVIGFILSPFILGGFFVYAVATLLYMGLLARYDYSIIQSLVIPLSLIAAYCVAGIFFKEKISAVNIIGMMIIIVGVTMAVKR